MTLDADTFRALVAETALSPSVHNTQPTRWRLTPDGRVQVLEDDGRRLPIGDPEGRDLNVSHGSAVEGFCLAAGRRGLVVDVRHDGVNVAELTVYTGGISDPLAVFLTQRRTYRGKFEGGEVARAALARLEGSEDLIIVKTPEPIAELARLYDEASLRWFRNAPYRAELVSWMRLSRRHPSWSLDGLNAEAMEMSGIEAVGAGVVLRPGVFETLDRVGLAGALVAEAAVVCSASAIVLFHRPADEAPFDTGRRFHRAWLGFTQAGLSAAPMAVLADDVEARERLQADFGIGGHRRLITAFRLGIAPAHDLAPKPRLGLDALIV
ncbi:hypothetical protein GCM10017620_30150 [Brevundimonas intermedia]|uniref:Nitroreductase n=1 Tax=Brevundimonas intermedia TaxID=74315 RepID=A0ABQ5TCJ1_9CAUL|nr:hypothetical protein [Brevundimonas intermedia]GLK50041.1 hypothetical protein GCM10017620_30150 [Brevundimonas intermedia]